MLSFISYLEQFGNDLSRAILQGDVETVQHLLSLGVSVDVRGGSQNVTPLLYASSMGSIEMATILLKHRADINAWDEDNQTCLHTAAYYNHVAVVNCSWKIMQTSKQEE